MTLLTVYRPRPVSKIAPCARHSGVLCMISPLRNAPTRTSLEIPIYLACIHLVHTCAKRAHVHVFAHSRYGTGTHEQVHSTCTSQVAVLCPFCARENHTNLWHTPLSVFFSAYIYRYPPPHPHFTSLSHRPAAAPSHFENLVFFRTPRYPRSSCRTCLPPTPRRPRPRRPPRRPPRARTPRSRGRPTGARPRRRRGNPPLRSFVYQCSRHSQLRCTAFSCAAVTANTPDHAAYNIYFFCATRRSGNRVTLAPSSCIYPVSRKPGYTLCIASLPCVRSLCIDFLKSLEIPMQ